MHAAAGHARRVHKPALGIDADVRLHAEVPLFVLLRGAHLGIALASHVFGGWRGGDQRRVHDRTATRAYVMESNFLIEREGGNVEMAVEPEEIDIGKNLPATSLEIDFALVLSRVVGAIKDDPAQLRNAVYELARIKLQREVWQRDPPLNVLEMRRLLLTLDSAIERVETISSRHDELRALQSLDQLLENSEIGSRKMMIEPREPLLIINQVPTYRTADSRPAFLAPVKRAPPSFAWLLRWPGPGPLLRGTIIGIFALALSVVLGHQFGLFGRQVPQPAAPMVQKMDRLEPKSVVQTPATMLRPAGPGFPLPTSMAFMR